VPKLRRRSELNLRTHKKLHAKEDQYLQGNQKIGVRNRRRVVLVEGGLRTSRDSDQSISCVSFSQIPPAILKKPVISGHIVARATVFEPRHLCLSQIVGQPLPLHVIQKSFCRKVRCGQEIDSAFQDEKNDSHKGKSSMTQNLSKAGTQFPIREKVRCNKSQLSQEFRGKSGSRAHAPYIK
jgi:hypothetical protein